MKLRLIAIIAVIAVITALVVAGTRFAMMGDVPTDDFDALIRGKATFRVEAHQVSAKTPLPLWIATRFPQSSTEGGLGLPDRTDVYTLTSSSGYFECHAHIRRDRVCFVTFERAAPPTEFLNSLASEFPILTVR